MEFGERQAHGNPTHRPMVRLGLLNTFRYTDEGRKRVHDWLSVAQPSGYTGMVPKGIPLKGPDAPGTMDYIEVPEDEWPMLERDDWW